MVSACMIAYILLWCNQLVQLLQFRHFYRHRASHLPFTDKFDL